MTYGQIVQMINLMDDASLGVNAFAAGPFEPLVWFAGAGAPAIFGGRGAVNWDFSRMYVPSEACAPYVLRRFCRANLPQLLGKINTTTRGQLPQLRTVLLHPVVMYCRKPLFVAANAGMSVVCGRCSRT